MFTKAKTFKLPQITILTFIGVLKRLWAWSENFVCAVSTLTPHLLYQSLDPPL